MVVERKAIDLRTLDNLDDLAREIRQHPEGLELLEDGRQLGIVTVPNPRMMAVAPESLRDRSWNPLAGLTPELRERLDAIPVHGTDGQPLPDNRKSPEEIARLLDAIRELAPYIDGDQLHRNVEESRRMGLSERVNPTEPEISAS